MPLALHSTGNASENRVRRNNAHFTWRNRTRFVRVIATEVESKLIRLSPVEFAKHQLTVSLSFQIEFRFDEHEKVRTILIQKKTVFLSVSWKIDTDERIFRQMFLGKRIELWKLIRFARYLSRIAPRNTVFRGETTPNNRPRAVNNIRGVPLFHRCKFSPIYRHAATT